MTRREEVKLTVLKVLEDKLGFPIEDIKEDSSLEYDLGVDSLDAIDLTMAFEVLYKTSYEDSEVLKLCTVADMIEFLCNN